MKNIEKTSCQLCWTHPELTWINLCPINKFGFVKYIQIKVFFTYKIVSAGCCPPFGKIYVTMQNMI